MPSLQSRNAGQVLLAGQTPSTSSPAPLSIDPTEAWVGNDGMWSPVTIGVGTPPQYVQLLISTASVQPWVVADLACQNPQNLSTPCATSRGGLFAKNASSTWNNVGILSLLSERNLGISASGNFGFDSVTLGIFGSKGGGVTVQNQTVAAIVNKNFWISTWGIRPDYTNFTTLNNRTASLLSNLKDAGTIPSLSWGYTAGAYYRSLVSKAASVSLTFGGSDSSRYQQHNTTFDMSADPERDLVVGIRSITSNATNSSLLPTQILSFVDAGVPHIWLPQDACDAFVDTFNLTYNSTLDRYLVNDTAHDYLLQTNPSITFSIADGLSNSNPPVNITLPYSSFDLQLTPDYPTITTKTRYFPLRKADNQTQYTLGRAFFQEAYVIADYERRKFSVHQTTFPDTVKQSLVPIPALPGTGPVARGGLSIAAAVGITIGSISSVLLLLGIFYWFRRKRAQPMQYPSSQFTNDFSEKGTPELHDNANLSEVQGSKPLPNELFGRQKESELDSCGNSRQELPDKELIGGELDASSRGSVSTIAVSGIFELPGSECATIADHSEYQLAKEITEVGGAKTWLSDDYVNEDYTVSRQGSTSMCATTRSDTDSGTCADRDLSNVSQHPDSVEHLNQQPTIFKSNFSRPVSLQDSQTRCPSIASQESCHSMVMCEDLTARESAIPNAEIHVPDGQPVAVQVDSEGVPFRVLPGSGSPEPCSVESPLSRTSQGSDRSVVSALSARPDVQGIRTGTDHGQLRIEVVSSIRKDSIVSPL